MTDTRDHLQPYAGPNAISADKVVPAMNELAQEIKRIAQKHELTMGEVRHVAARLLEQLVEVDSLENNK